ncbi:hypothetical protein BE18_13910 [Sorangium cellulosum]|uniref:RNA polymerase sigma-70 region 2 domain-containing protein n=1 Tax=Sorangium cellulosum TaxID=56 RepID=A0A150SBP5_SORCE|nr:hypothetical protein BE18_13910 [Sorangium cellulosum]
MAVIWDRYSGLVRGVLYGALGPDTSLEDLVQEVFLSLIQGAARIQDGQALRGYLATIAARQAALEIRKRKIRRWVASPRAGSSPSAPSSASTSSIARCSALSTACSTG